jgi:polyhydroxyalkanoate synthesis regulator phasin
MADARRSSGSRTGGAARKSSARSTRAATRSSSSATKRSAAAKKGGQARARQQRAAKAAPSIDFSGKSVAELRSALKGGVITPLNLVMLTRERIEEVLDDAVSRGRVTSADARKLSQDLVTRGRKQTNEVLRDLEQLLGRGSSGVRKRGSVAAGRARKQVGEATARARSAADPVLVRADRARRAAGVGPNFPVTGYDELTVARIQKRLGSLTPAELRKVRDYEKRHANRKTILSSIEQRLGG